MNTISNLSALTGIGSTRSLDMTNYELMEARIRKAKSGADVTSLESSLDRLYFAGVFTPNELGRLDSLLMDTKAKIKES